MWYHITRAGDWDTQPGRWYFWESTLMKCQSVAQQSVKATSKGQPCRHHQEWWEEEVLQAAGPAVPEMPLVEADTNLATHERLYVKAAGNALKKAAALWELIFLYFQSAIKLIFLKSISLLMMVSDEWSPSLYLPWAVPPLLSKLSLLRRERERATEWGSGKASQAQPIPYPVKILK